MEHAIKIGRLARDAGVNVETIRYYQRRGLLDQPEKPQGGHRHYGPGAIQRVRFIKRAQHLGFSLSEIRNLVMLEDGRHCRETRLLAEKKLAVIDARLAQLARARGLLEDLVAQCARDEPPKSCPIIRSLSANGSCRA